MERLKDLVDRRFFALFLKEMRQILRDRQLLFLLAFPPTFQIFLYGYALSPEVKDLRLGVVDLAACPVSRELTSAIVENHVFDIKSSGGTQTTLLRKVQEGKIDAAMIVPPEFNRDLRERKTADVQIVLDGVDANSAGIAGGYLSQIFSQFNLSLSNFKPEKDIHPDITFLYNPGLISAWFFVPGVMGLVLNLAGSLVSSATLVREKDSGTLEQLVMTPAGSHEILIAKIAPLFVLLMGNVCLSLTIGRVFFAVPFRGNAFLFFGISALYVFVAIAVGITLATISRNQRQAILTSFFFNLPLIQLSGGIAPLHSMPIFFQYLALLNPLRYYVECIRGVLLRGVGLEVLWPDVLALAVFAVVLMAASGEKFRSQLG